jgi:hypothetical protein
MPITKVTFRVHLGDQETQITEAELGPYASLIGLDRVAPKRYSWLFVLNLYLNEVHQGVDPHKLVQEIRDIETGYSTAGTKPATQFQRPPLQGLWHKHFFSAHFVAHNILNHLSGNKMMKLAEHVFDPAISPIVTKEMINKFAHEVSHGAMEQRIAKQKLTGEWIVFAKHESQNYYLCVSTHTSGDQTIYDSICSACLIQFPFLVLWEAPVSTEPAPK